jgi:3-oxoacyl-(acyl-carrier-protein) synthase
MDPQQRLLLETAYAALHVSGARQSTLLGGEGGVFVGIERPDWALLAFSWPASVYAVTGDTTSVASGRVSFALGLQGPCVSVDTACSSALVALHGAWRAVVGGECPEGTAAAVSLKLAPQPTLGAAAAGMLSVDGRCKTWDVRANGYVRSEGVGCTVVAPGGEGAAGVGLLGLAVRQDGRSASLTAPNGSAQRTLLQAALASAGVAAAALARLEAHGTGTALGDPTEAGSLAATLLQAPGSERASPLGVGASKASIGHGEAASGQSGVQRLAAALGRLSSGGNAQLRQLNPLVGELWKERAAVLSTQPVQAGCGGGRYPELALARAHSVTIGYLAPVPSTRCARTAAAFCPSWAACRRSGTAARSRTRCCRAHRVPRRWVRATSRRSATAGAPSRGPRPRRKRLTARRLLSTPWAGRSWRLQPRRRLAASASSCSPRAHLASHR